MGKEEERIRDDVRGPRRYLLGEGPGPSGSVSRGLGLPEGVKYL